MTITVLVTRLLAMLTLGLMVGLTAKVAIRHSVLLYEGQKNPKNRFVVCIGISYILLSCLVFSRIAELISAKGDVTYFAPIAFIGAAIGLYGLWTLLRDMWRRSR